LDFELLLLAVADFYHFVGVGEYIGGIGQTDVAAVIQTSISRLFLFFSELF